MAPPDRGSAAADLAVVGSLLTPIPGLVLLGGVWYFVIGQLYVIDVLRPFESIIAIVQRGGIGIVVVSFLAYVGIESFRIVRARRASTQVVQALKKIQVAAPGTTVSAITPKQVAEAVKGVNVNTEQFARLVEQHKQGMLIDDDAFQAEVGELIVDYLQPLPRNAKRLLNRLRVNLLIAEGRGLFKTTPKVTTQQVVKWLVLGERWPQLRLALSAAPERMKGLERQVRAGRSRGKDEFMKSIKLLAPVFAGDEDLRRFMQSEPPLADVLERLVHYGTPTAEPPAQQAPPPPQ